MKNWIVYCCLSLFLVVSFLLPDTLARHYISIGEGPDEIAHLDHIFFRYTRPDSLIQVERGLVEPGLSPQGQGHQAPLYYRIASGLLSLWLPARVIGPFWDYQSGIWYSSMAAYTHGKPACEVRVSEPDGAGGDQIRTAIYRLRTANALLLPLSIVLSFLAARLVFPARPILALAVACLHSGVPNAVWRSSFVTNDNLVSTLGSLTFLIATAYLTRRNANAGLVALAAVSAALAFWAKYTGAAAIGVVLAAIVLRSGLSIRSRLIHIVLAGSLFAACIAPELLHNMRVEGGPFLTAAVAREFPYLYKPSSHFHVLFRSGFVSELLGRFWLEFHNLGVLDESFPLWRVYAWWGLSAVAFIGVIRFATSRAILPDVDRRLVVFAAASCFAAFALVIHLAVTFPLAGGRYLHTMLGPAAILTVIGLAALAGSACRGRAADLTTLAIVLGFTLFGWHSTFSYQAEKYAGCSTPTRGDVPGGAAFGAGDVDGDGVDELYIYHRHPGRMFFLVRSDDGPAYRLEADRTRAFGLQGDHFQLGDVTGDGRDDVVIHRPNLQGLFILDATKIIRHDPSLSGYSDRAVEFLGAWLDHKKIDYSSQLILADLEGSADKEILVYNPRNAEWRSYDVVKTATGRAVVSFAPTMKFGGSRKRAFAMRRRGVDLIGVLGSGRGVIYLGHFHAKHLRATITLPPGQAAGPVDSDGDGVDDLMTWQVGSDCVTIRGGVQAADAIPLSGERLACLRLESSPFRINAHHVVFSVGNGPGRPDSIAVADRRTGIILIFPFSNRDGTMARTVLEGRRVDPGFLRAAERAEAFDPSHSG